MNRRRFLKRGIFGGALLAFGGTTFVAVRSTTRGPAPTDLYAIDPKVFSVLVAVAARMVDAPEKDPFLVARAVDTALAFQPPESQKDVNTVLALLENGLFGLITRATPRLFTELSEERQDRALASWQTSRLTLLRGAFTALKRLCLASHYAILENAQAVGYPGPPFEKPAPPPISFDQPLSPPFVPSVERDALDEQPRREEQAP